MAFRVYLTPSDEFLRGCSHKKLFQNHLDTVF